MRCGRRCSRRVEDPLVFEGGWRYGARAFFDSRPAMRGGRRCPRLSNNAQAPYLQRAREDGALDYLGRGVRRLRKIARSIFVAVREIFQYEAECFDSPPA